MVATDLNIYKLLHSDHDAKRARKERKQPLSLNIYICKYNISSTSGGQNMHFVDNKCES